MQIRISVTNVMVDCNQRKYLVLTLQLQVEEMGNRIDGLERSLSKIVKQLEAKQSAQEPEATESSE